MQTVLMSLVLMAAGSMGPRHCGHDVVRQECTTCDEESPAVARQIHRLQSAGWIARKKAARALRSYDWKSHPEAAEALAEALLHDDCRLVRQQAAESLAKMRPCLPTVHEAVARAARCDRSLLARHWAKKALKSLGKTCVESCSICEVEDLGPWRGEGAVILPDDSRIDPLPSAIVPIPEQSPGASPFNPRNRLSLPEAVPGEMPPLESPALP